MNLAEMIDAVVAKGGDGQAVVDELIEFGHLPPDANERAAGLTAHQCRQFERIVSLLRAEQILDWLKGQRDRPLRSVSGQ